MKRLFEIGAMLVVIMLLAGCSSTNLNGVNVRMSGGWFKGSPFDAQTPGKIEIGMGTASFTMIPLARGQGAEFRAITFELISGRPLFQEEIIIYPVGQDAMLKLSRSPQSILKIPFVIDLKADVPEDSVTINPTKVELIPVGPVKTDVKPVETPAVK